MGSVLGPGQRRPELPCQSGCPVSPCPVRALASCRTSPSSAPFSRREPISSPSSLLTQAPLRSAEVSSPPGGRRPLSGQSFRFVPRPSVFPAPLPGPVPLAPTSGSPCTGVLRGPPLPRAEEATEPRPPLGSTRVSREPDTQPARPGLREPGRRDKLGKGGGQRALSMVLTPKSGRPEPVIAGWFSVCEPESPLCEPVSCPRRPSGWKGWGVSTNPPVKLLWGERRRQGSSVCCVFVCLTEKNKTKWNVVKRNTPLQPAHP